MNFFLPVLHFSIFFLFVCLLFFFLSTKIKPHPSFYHTKFSNYVKFHYNTLQSHKYVTHNLQIFMKKSMPERNACPAPAYNSL